MKTILITGFGPFGKCDNNPSWLAVKALKMEKVKLIKHNIEVSYSVVDKKIPELIELHKPDFVIHCGYSVAAKDITIETLANGNNYTRKDVHNCVPENYCSTLQETENECIRTLVDTQAIFEKVNALKEEGKITVGVSLSENAGRYLCEYMYFASLKTCPEKALFLHIPSISEKKQYTAENFAATIAEIIKELLNKKKSKTT